MAESDRVRVGIVLPVPPAGVRSPAAALASVRVKLGVFCQVLSENIGMRVSPCTFQDYATLLDAMNNNKVDLAWLPPRLAASAAAVGSIVPLVVPVRGESAWYHTALFSYAASPVRALEDLKGMRAAWVDPESLAGYCVIRGFLRSRGIDCAAAFRQESFVGAHSAVVEAVLSQQADVGATFVHLGPDEKTILSAGWGEADVNVIAVAGPIPGDVLACSEGLAEEAIGAVTVALTGGEISVDLRAAALALLEADRFVVADVYRLSTLAEFLKHLDN
jgi:phosphonate transport system substrate-binding protein